MNIIYNKFDRPLQSLAMTSLDQAIQGHAYWITQVNASEQMPDCQRQLNELGFIGGEQVVLMRRTLPGSDPLVVRIGLSTFALRKAEAACIELQDHPPFQGGPL